VPICIVFAGYGNLELSKLASRLKESNRRLANVDACRFLPSQNSRLFRNDLDRTIQLIHQPGQTHSAHLNPASFFTPSAWSYKRHAKQFANSTGSASAVQSSRILHILYQGFGAPFAFATALQSLQAARKISSDRHCRVHCNSNLGKPYSGHMWRSTLLTMDLVFSDRARYIMDVDNSLDLLQYIVQALFTESGSHIAVAVRSVENYEVLRIPISLLTEGVS